MNDAIFLSAIFNTGGYIFALGEKILGNKIWEEAQAVYVIAKTVDVAQLDFNRGPSDSARTKIC